MDLTAVPPARASAAAALVLGGVAGQDVVAEVDVFQVVEAVLPQPLLRGGVRRGARLPCSGTAAHLTLGQPGAHTPSSTSHDVVIQCNLLTCRRVL